MKIKLLFTIAVFICFSSHLHSQCSYGFYDSGGAAGNYNNNENLVYTYCPDYPDSMINVIFTEIDIEAFSDGLYIFNGNSTSSPQIMSTNSAGNVPGGLSGAYWGSELPPPITSSSPDGCLTFQFRSNNSGTTGGWAANVFCGPVQECYEPYSLSASAVTSTEVIFGWTSPGPALSWEVLALPCGIPAPTASTSGILTTANPYIFTGLAANMCYQLYVRSICEADQISPWSGAVTVTTNDVPAVCGGVYYDSNGPSQNYDDNDDAITTICPELPGEVVTVHFNAFSTEAENDALYVFNGSSILAPQISSANPAGNVPGGLSGGFWGSDIPASFTSSSVEGCLTFRFRSNESINASGWDASITCGLPEMDVLSLLAFIDTNGNSIKDAGEQVFPQGSYSYQINNAGTVLSGNANYYYNIYAANPSDTYDLSYQINADYEANYQSNVTFNDVSIEEGSGVNYFYFPIVLTSGFNDVAVNIIADNNPQPGFSYFNTVVVQNLGTAPVAGTITFTKDPLLTIDTVYPPGATLTADGFTYSYVNLQPFQVRTYDVYMTVPTIPTVNLGTVLTNTATITGAADDLIAENNSASYTDVVVGSYDPNDIMESHGPQIVFADFDTDEYLYYTIRFQNTGTANATTVRVENLLDGQLDPASISMVAASHDYNMTRNGNQLTWQFEDIQLVPESVNNDDSNGYILYKIKPNPGFEIGDIIPSIAEIYFDFNPAIITETFYSEFVAQLAVADFGLESIQFYPNPANSMITVSSGSSQQINTLAIYDMLGKSLIQKENLSSAETEIDVSDLSKGYYTVVITTSDNTRTVKKLIIK